MPWHQTCFRLVKSNEIAVDGWRWLERRLMPRKMMRREQQNREEEFAQLDFLSSLELAA